jgi:SPP1 family phage portal protein
MELTELKTLIDDPTKLVSKIKSLAPEIPEQALNFEPEKHGVTKIDKRPNRPVEVDTGIVGTDGLPIYRTEYRDVHRIPSATEKIIVDWSVNLSLGAGVGIDCVPVTDTDKKMVAMIERTLEDNKMDYLRMEIERLRLVYLQVLVVWYMVDAEEGFWGDLAGKVSTKKWECSVFSPEDGNIIVPIRDQYKKMIGCARLYTVKIDDKDVNKMDLLLKERNITFEEAAGGWLVEATFENKVGKACFILYEAKRRVYQDVEPKLERREEIDSDTADENKMSAFPILVGTGTIVSAKGGENANTRKTFQLEGQDADLKYVETKGGQEAANKERENMLRDIYMETNTPQVSFDSSSFTGDMPGVSIELMFLPSTNQAKANQRGPIGMSIQREFNFLKSAMAQVNVDVKASVSLQIKPLFAIDLPRNKTEDIGNISSLYAAGLISRETAVKKLDFTEDADAEIAAIEKEAAAKAALAPKPKPIKEKTNP